ncbi:hypothetical protein FACS1894137_02290 [Spirochaetia bacterium]|nr:hypothetical protein FACS1894137_02290 [Spirochaetia bacterium]
MKKIYGLVVLSLFAVVLFGCASSAATSGSSASSGQSAPASGSAAAPEARKVPGSVPDFVKQALKNCPEDSVVAVAVSRLRDMGLAKQRAEVLARGELSRQIKSVASSMIRDYAAGSEVDPSAELGITEALNTAISNQALAGARIVEYDIIDGATWIVMEMPEPAAQTVINQSAAAAKLAPAWAASLDAEERMQAMIEKNNLNDIAVVSE